MSITMRAGTPADMPRIQQIVEEIWAIGGDFVMEEKYGAVGDERWDRWMVPKAMSRIWDEIDTLIVTELDGQVVGFITYGISTARRVGSIHFNGVSKAGRGNGIGTRQVARVIEIFREAKMEYACVGTGLNEGHAAARRVYEKCGFERLIDYTMYSQKL
jgi:RimJ/RimL family protein N-acetyltransferase